MEFEQYLDCDRQFPWSSQRVAGGNVTVTASFLTATPGTAGLTVSAAPLQSIVVSPAQVLLAPASTVSYQAVGQYSDGIEYLSPAWNSSDTNIVTINASGVATGSHAGTATTTATYQGVTSNAASVVVSQFPLVSISVAPAIANQPPSVPFGVSIPFAATGTFSDGSKQSLTTSATWASSPSAVATVSNANLQQGVATGVTPGQAAITAVFAGQVGSATLTVTNATIMSITVTPTNSSAPPGTPVTFTATGKFSDGTVQNLTTQVAWSSSNATVATISPNGQVSTANVGVTMITATFTQNGVSVSDSTALTVQ